MKSPKEVPVAPAAGGTGGGLPGLVRRGPHLAAQLPGGAADVVPDLGGQFGDGLPDLQLQIGQLARAARQFGAARVGDRVDLATALGDMGDEALGLQLGQPRIDRARRRRVQPLETLLQEPDHLVAMARASSSSFSR